MKYVAKLHLIIILKKTKGDERSKKMISIIIIALQLTFSGYSSPYPLIAPLWITPVHEFEPLEL